MSVFGTEELGCGIFGGTAPCGGGATYALSHARAAHLHYGSVPTQDARGELHLSFIGIGTIPIEMQPENRGLLRQIHGIVLEIAWVGFTGLGADIRELDRVYFLGQHLEVTQVLTWPDHQEIWYQEIGR